MRKLINASVFVLATLMSANSFSYNSDPKALINELVNDAINTLSNKDISIAKKKINVYINRVFVSF